MAVPWRLAMLPTKVMDVGGDVRSMSELSHWCHHYCPALLMWDQGVGLLCGVDLRGDIWQWLHTSSYWTGEDPGDKCWQGIWVSTWTTMLLWCNYMSDELGCQRSFRGDCMCIQPRLSAKEGRSAWARWQVIKSDESWTLHENECRIKSKVNRDTKQGQSNSQTGEYTRWPH